MNRYFVYILANKPHGAIYVGFTDDIYRRVQEHKLGLGSRHTAKYHIHMLVYFEEHDSSDDAFIRERQIKEWKREWKVELIEDQNPMWEDLYPRLDQLIQPI